MAVRDRRRLGRSNDRAQDARVVPRRRGFAIGVLIGRDGAPPSPSHPRLRGDCGADCTQRRRGDVVAPPIGVDSSSRSRRGRVLRARREVAARRRCRLRCGASVRLANIGTSPHVELYACGRGCRCSRRVFAAAGRQTRQSQPHRVASSDRRSLRGGGRLVTARTDDDDDRRDGRERPVGHRVDRSGQPIMVTLLSLVGD